MTFSAMSRGVRSVHWVSRRRYIENGPSFSCFRNIPNTLGGNQQMPQPERGKDPLIHAYQTVHDITSPLILRHSVCTLEECLTSKGVEVIHAWVPPGSNSAVGVAFGNSSMIA